MSNRICKIISSVSIKAEFMLTKLHFTKIIGTFPDLAEVAELADAQDSKSCSRKGVRVRFPPSAMLRQNTDNFCPALPEYRRQNIC
jgi:hypothetical protein